MHKIFKVALPSKAILAPTITYIGALKSLRWSPRRRSGAEVGVRRRRSEDVGGGGRRRRSEAEVGGGGRRRVEVDVRVRICCGVVEVVVQASGFARGLSIPVFISVFQFIVFQLISNWVWSISWALRV